MRRLLACAVIASVAFALPASAEEEKRSSTAVREKVNALKVSLDSGDVIVKPGRSTAVDVVARWSRSEPEVEISVENGVLAVSAECPRLVPFVRVGIGDLDECSTDIVVTLASATVDVTVDTSGDLSLTGVRGRHQLATNSGGVTVSRTSGPLLELRTGGGDVVLGDLRSEEVRASTGSGAIEVHRSAVARRLELDTNGGDVTLRKSSAGELVVEVGSGHIEVSDTAVREAAALDTNGGRVRVRALTADRLGADTGSGEVTLHNVRTKSTVDVRTNGGDVEATDVVATRLNASTGSGDVTITGGRANALSARTNGGAVAARGARTVSYDLASGSGPITVVAPVPPERLTADTNGGDVIATVPRGAYAVEFDTNGGTITIDGITPDGRSGRRIDLRTGSGDITLLGR